MVHGPAAAFTKTWSDAAKRCSDHINLHAVVNPFAIGQFAAIRLSDGGSDGELYQSRSDAVRHQLHEKLCAYVCIPPGGMTPEEAESFLATHRTIYDSGVFQFTDPETSHLSWIPPLRQEGMARAMRRLSK